MLFNLMTKSQAEEMAHKIEQKMRKKADETSYDAAFAHIEELLRHLPAGHLLVIDTNYGLNHYEYWEKDVELLRKHLQPDEEFRRIQNEGIYIFNPELFGNNPMKYIDFMWPYGITYLDCINRWEYVLPFSEN